MPSNDSTSARAPDDACYACGHNASMHAEMTGECVRCHCDEFMLAPATPPSDETPGDPLICAKCGKRKMQWINYPERAPRCINDACNAPLVDTGAPTAGGAWSDEYHTLDQAVMDAQALPRTDRHIAILTRIRDRFAPPSPEGTGTPPTPSELPSRTELGVGGAGELPGVSEYEGAQALTSVFAFAKRECYSDEEEIVDVAERYVAGLRLRAEAAEQTAFDAELLGRQATMYARQASYWRNEYAVLADANRAAAQKDRDA